jgi:hypothetical protein
MTLTKEIIENIKESPEDTIKEISKLESWALIADEDLKEKWKNILYKLDEIKNKKELNTLFLKLFAYLNTGDMIKFTMELNSKNNDIFFEFIEQLDKTKDKELLELNEIFKERLMVLYRLNIIPKIFSEDRVTSLRIALGKY